MKSKIIETLPKEVLGVQREIAGEVMGIIPGIIFEEIPGRYLGIIPGEVFR